MNKFEQVFKPSEIDLIILALENEYEKRKEALQKMEDNEAKAYAEEQLIKYLLIYQKLHLFYRSKN